MDGLDDKNLSVSLSSGKPMKVNYNDWINTCMDIPTVQRSVDEGMRYSGGVTV